MRTKRFFFIYWFIVIAIVALFSIIDGRKRKDLYFEVKGKVIDQIPVFKSGDYVLMPQVHYPLNDTEYVFVDHNTYRPTGETVTVLVSLIDPQDARIYSPGFWINQGVVVPVFMFAGFIFSIILIARSKKDRKNDVLPGHLDNIMQKE